MYLPKLYKKDILNDKETYNSFIKNWDILANIVHSNYDITKKCNMTCNGCYFFEGDDYKNHQEISSLEEWDNFFKQEKDRGVVYPYIAGAEPSLVQDRLHIANKYFSQGCVFTNGATKIDDTINFRIHISVWGVPSSEELVRKDSFFLHALQIYKNDPRALFVFTINANNIDEIEEVIKYCQEWNAKLTFNLFSPTTDYLKQVNNILDVNTLILDEEKLKETRYILDNFIDLYPDTVVYNKSFNHWITNPNGIYEIDSSTGIAIDCGARNDQKNMHFRTDFSSSNSKCCLPNIDCRNCRAYAVAYGSATARYKQFIKTREGFDKWNEIAELWREIFFSK